MPHDFKSSARTGHEPIGERVLGVPGGLVEQQELFTVSIPRRIP
jgi:hypothetical protein